MNGNSQRSPVPVSTAERRISQLEKILEREKGTNRDSHNCYRIGYTQFQLSQLYKMSGVSDKSRDMLKDAFLTLQNPECKKGKKTDNLLNTISFCINNPMAPPFVQLPPLLRYLSPIILLIGYVSVYLTYIFGLISYTLFFLIIFAVFIISMIVTGLLSRSYMTHIQREYASQQLATSEYAGKKSSENTRTPDGVVDDARAELSLANMYYSMKNIKEMESHLKRARSFLDDPLTDQSTKKEQAMGVLNKLESALRERKPKEHYNL